MRSAWSQRSINPPDEGAAVPRIDGATFYRWAESAETAVMPSVAMLCEEMGHQREFLYDASKDSKEAMDARDKVAYGKLDLHQAMHTELMQIDEEKKVKKAAMWHYTAILTIKVLVGNALQLWLQSSFYGVTFDVTGLEAKIKVIVMMACSTLLALIRCKLIVPKLGLVGVALAAMIMILSAWAGVKVYFVYKCASHVWNISSGCVDLDE